LPKASDLGYPTDMMDTIPPPSKELLDRTPPEVLAYFMATIDALTKRVEQAEARVAQLEEQLKLNSKNSSKPRC